MNIRCDGSSSSVKKDPWTRKRQLEAKAAVMREAKQIIREGEAIKFQWGA